MQLTTNDNVVARQDLYHASLLQMANNKLSYFIRSHDQHINFIMNIIFIPGVRRLKRHTPGFLKFCREVSVCVHPGPQAIKNHSHEMKHG